MMKEINSAKSGDSDPALEPQTRCVTSQQERDLFGEVIAALTARETAVKKARHTVRSCVGTLDRIPSAASLISPAERRQLAAALIGAAKMVDVIDAAPIPGTGVTTPAV